MNWLTNLIKAGEKIKERIREVQLGKKLKIQNGCLLAVETLRF